MPHPMTVYGTSLNSMLIYLFIYLLLIHDDVDVRVQVHVFTLETTGSTLD